MAANKIPASKQMKVSLDQYVRTPDGAIDTSWNVREATSYRPDELADLRDSIVAAQAAYGGAGLTDPVTLMSESEGYKPPYRIIKGHRRTLVLEQMEYKGEIPAIVFPKMDRATFMHLLLDQGQQRSLSVVELFIAIKKGFEAGLSEPDLAVSLSGLLAHFYPPTEKFKEEVDGLNQQVADNKMSRYEADKEIRKLTLNRHRGTIQTRKRVLESPYCVEDQFVRRLRGGKGDGWPTDAEIKRLHEVFTTEKKENPMITRQQPGTDPEGRDMAKKFMELWSSMAKAKEEAKEENGGRRTKKFSMMSNSDVEDLAGKTDSRIVRAVLFRVLNKADGEAFAKIIQLALKLEKNLSAEDMDVLAVYFKAKEQVQTGTGNIEANKPNEEVPA
jgi:hypothetical protein